MNLFKRNKEGINLDEFKEIFDLYYNQIRNYLYYKTGDISLAEDTAQDVFVKVWEKKLEVKLETIKSLLYTIAGNQIKNHFKHQQVVFKYENDSNKNEVTQETPHFQMEEEEFSKHLQKCIDELSEGQREVFLMNRIDKLTYVQISESLGISVKAVEKRMHNALMQLKEKLKHQV